MNKTFTLYKCQTRIYPVNITYLSLASKSLTSAFINN